MLVVRAARSDDHAAFVDLARAAGPGFTSLSLDDEALHAKLLKSEQAFEGKLPDRSDCVYQLMLEDDVTGQVYGTAAVKAQVGVKKPYFDFKIFTIAQSSKEAERRFDMDAMLLVNDFAGCTEVGSLFVSDALRGSGAGRLTSQCRYMLVAADRSRFGSRILSELRGVVDERGESVFYEHVTRPFFRMSFEEADTLSASTDNQFILDLMPRSAIFLDLLPSEVQAVIGKTHPHGANALRLLEDEGFRYDRYVDIFDGGPLVSCETDDVRTIKDSRLMTVADRAPGSERVRALVSNNQMPDFRCVHAEVSVTGDAVSLDADAARALKASAGQTVRLWTKELS
ncbi:arginine N-succinyltransferase [Oceanicaulis sp.]|uniref:arginine N-succinyltransferase n=1 Tax=Oceanicaulis sp. TaxID=1924941 RepID=UPI003D27B939